MNTTFLASVMFHDLMCNEADMMPPHFFSQFLRVHAAAYTDVLDTVLKERITVVARMPYIRALLHFLRPTPPKHF